MRKFYFKQQLLDNKYNHALYTNYTNTYDNYYMCIKLYIVQCIMYSVRTYALTLNIIYYVILFIILFHLKKKFKEYLYITFNSVFNINNIIFI